MLRISGNVKTVNPPLHCWGLGNTILDVDCQTSIFGESYVLWIVTFYFWARVGQSPEIFLYRRFEIFVANTNIKIESSRLLGKLFPRNRFCHYSHIGN